jgi:hypothetical protein
MASIIARQNVMPGKDDESVSPYLRKPTRTYEDATREQAKRRKPPDPKKDTAEPGSTGKAEHAPKPGKRK